MNSKGEKRYFRIVMFVITLTVALILLFGPVACGPTPEPQTTVEEVKTAVFSAFGSMPKNMQNGRWITLPGYVTEDITTLLFVDDQGLPICIMAFADPYDAIGLSCTVRR